MEPRRAAAVWLMLSCLLPGAARGLEESVPVSYDVRTGEEIIHLDPALPDRPDGFEPGTTLLEQVASMADEPWNFTDLIPVPAPVAYPWRMRVKLGIFFPDDDSGGSGILIDARHVLTAGHCVHQGPSGTWATAVTVIPAYDEGWRPYGHAQATQLHSWTGWTGGASVGDDMGIIDLDRAIGMGTGWVGYGFNDDDDFFEDNTFLVAGYPAAAPYDGQKMYYRSGWFDTTDELYVRFDRQCYQGESGSAFVHNDGQYRTAYAVQARLGSDETYCPRITGAKFALIQNWIAQDISPALDLEPGFTYIYPHEIPAGTRLEYTSFNVLNYSWVHHSAWLYFDVYLSENDLITPMDRRITGGSVADFELAPRGTAQINFGLPPFIPHDQPPGDYYLGVILDIDDADPSNDDTSGQDAAPIRILPLATSTPTRTPTPRPTYTPTATPESWVRSVEIFTSQETFQGGDPFTCWTRVVISGISVPVFQVVVLEVPGAYYFWPAWTQEPAGLHRTWMGGVNDETLLEFPWPYDDLGSQSGLRFYLALLDPVTGEVLRNWDMAEWGYR